MRWLLLFVLFLAGCSMQSAEVLNARNFRGCYAVAGKISSPGIPSALLDAQGYVLTGDMTVEDCRLLQEGINETRF